MTGITASSAGLVSCHACALLVSAGSDPHHKHTVAQCPRCGSSLHARKTNAIQRATALSLAALVCYVPANALPIMTVISFGEGAPDTIASGITALFLHGMYPVALLVFFASILVPVLKLLAMGYLLISVHRRSAWRPRDRVIVYRVTEFIGRWSMIDIFMISLLAALVKLGSIATIEPGAGAVFFAAVVILTMFAAMSFDPRLIWDRLETKDG